jgi:hypothetical protein
MECEENMKFERKTRFILLHITACDYALEYIDTYTRNSLYNYVYFTITWQLFPMEDIPWFWVSELFPASATTIYQQQIKIIVPQMFSNSPTDS